MLSASCWASAARADWTCATTSRKPCRIREQVGDEEVILGLSGGVDSSWLRR
jgi:GMP synthase PP-ATPase subunit